MLRFVIIFYIVIVSNYCGSILLYREYRNETHFVQTCATEHAEEKNWALARASKSIKNYSSLKSKYDDDEYININNYSTKKMGRSIHYKLEHIVDKRWEDFETTSLEPAKPYEKKYLKDETLQILHLSLLFEDEIEIIITRGSIHWCAVLDKSKKSVQFEKKCKPAQKSNAKTEGYILWQHYTIYVLGNDTYMLQDSTELIESSKPIKIRAIKFSSPTDAFLKIHDHQFLVLDQAKTEVFSSTISKPKEIDDLGICMYIFANVKCDLMVQIQDNNTKSVLLQEKYSGEGRWILKYLSIKNKNEPIEMMIERNGSCEMTFLDGIRFCTENETQKLEFESSSLTDSCANMDNKLITYSDPKPLLSNDLNYEKYRYLFAKPKLVFCRGGSCYCPPGYVGEFCDKVLAGEVNNVRIMNITAKSAKVYFDPPNESNGTIIKYRINYYILRYGACENNTYLHEKNISVNTLMADLTELEPFAEYSLEICAINEAGCGKTVNKTFNTEGVKKFNSGEEIYFNSSNALNLIFPDCEMVKGNITYTIIASCFHESLCEGDNFTSFEYHLRSDYIQFIQSLRPYSTYDLYIISKKHDDIKRMPPITFKTPPGKPNPVVDLTVYNHNTTCISLRWKPPHVSTGFIEYYGVKTCLKDNCNDITSKKPCSLWVGYFCEEIHNITRSESYNIFVYAKNLNNPSISDSQMKRAITFEYAPQRPLNLVAERLWLGGVVLTWHHPEKTNGQLRYFEIYFWSNESKIKEERIPVETHTAVYTHQVNQLPAFKTYDVYIKAGNQYLGSKSNTVKFSLYITETIIIVFALLVTGAIMIFIGNYIWKKRGRQYRKINYSDNPSESSIIDMEETPMNTYIDGYKGKNTFRLTNCDLKTPKGEETLESEILRTRSDVLVLLGKEDTEILQKYEIQIRVFVFDLNNLSLIPRHIDQMKNIMHINARSKVPIIINSRVKGDGQMFTKCFNMMTNSNIDNIVENISKKIDEYGFVFYHYYKHQNDHPPYPEDKITKVNDEDERKYLQSIEDLNREIYYISHIKQMNDDDVQSEFTIKTILFTYVVRNLELFSVRPGTGNPKLIVLLGSTPAIRELEKQVLSSDNKIFVFTTTINEQAVPIIQWNYETPFIQKNKDKFYTFYYYYRHIIKHFNPEEIHIYSRDVSSGIVIASDMFIDDLLQSKPFDVQKIIYAMMYEFRQLTVEYVGQFLFNLFRKHWKQFKYMNDDELNFDINSYFPQPRTETTGVIHRAQDTPLIARVRNIQFSDPVVDKKTS